MSTSTPASSPAPVADTKKVEEPSDGFFKNLDTTGKVILFLLGGSALILIIMLFFTLIGMGSHSVSGGVDMVPN